MTRLSRRTAVLSGLTAGTAALVAGPETLVRAAGAARRWTPAAPAVALAAHLDVGRPSFLAFLHEAGINTSLIGPAIPAAGYLVQEIRGGVYWVTDGSYN